MKREATTTHHRSPRESSDGTAAGVSAARGGTTKIVQRLFGDLALPGWSAPRFYHLFCHRRFLTAQTEGSDGSSESGGGGGGEDLPKPLAEEYVGLLMRLTAMRFRQHDHNFRLEDRRMASEDAAQLVVQELYRKTRKMRLDAETQIEAEDLAKGAWYSPTMNDGDGAGSGRLLNGVNDEGVLLVLQAINTTMRRIVSSEIRREAERDLPQAVSWAAPEGVARHGVSYLDQSRAGGDASPASALAGGSARVKQFWRDHLDTILGDACPARHDDMIAVELLYWWSISHVRHAGRLPAWRDVPARIKHRIRPTQHVAINRRLRAAFRSLAGELAAESNSD